MTTAGPSAHLTESEFDRGVAVTSQPADRSAGYGAELDGGWSIRGGIDGGLLLAVCANALKQTFAADGHPDPFSISAYFVSVGRAGAATLSTDVVRRGRSTSTGAVSLTQTEDGRPVERVRALGTYGDLAALPPEVHTTAAEPDLPEPDRCLGTDLAPRSFRETAPLFDRVDLRLDPDCVGWAMGEPSGRGLMRGWLRLADGREPDPLFLLVALDALPPVTFDLGLAGWLSWAPTLELTAYVRALPAPGWLKVAHSTRNFAGGLLEEDAEVWDSSGRLVAQSRQLVRASRPQAD